MNVEALYPFGWLVGVHEQASNLEVSEVNQHGLENYGLLPKWLLIQDQHSTHVFLWVAHEQEVSRVALMIRWKLLNQRPRLATVRNSDCTNVTLSF